MEYNTQRPKLKISDYGRNIYKLIQYAKGIEDRGQRNRMAQTIVNIMARGEDGKRPKDEDQRRYWVHLMILADWDLDIDVPYDISPEESVEFKPRRMTYGQKGSRFHHYGHIMEEMVKRAAEYPDGEERDALIARIAHAMKRDYLLWNRDTVEDEVINSQMELLSQGRIQVKQDFRYQEAGSYLAGGKEDSFNLNNKKKRKKKKKRKPQRQVF